jgi:hypothetical protein
MRSAFGSLTCVNCNKVVRDDEAAWEINDRAWCAGCAAPYTGLRAMFAGTLGMLLRLAGVLGIFAVGFVLSTFAHVDGISARRIVIGASIAVAAGWWRMTSPGNDVVAKKLAPEERTRLLR